jgi:predicted dehydrogenase
MMLRLSYNRVIVLACRCAIVALISISREARQLRHFLAVIAAREAPLISVQDAIGTLAVVEAVREAARTGTRVSPGQIMEQAA